MILYLAKLFISAGIIVLVSEVAKRTSVLGGLILSLPLTSLLAILWLFVETKDAQRIASLSWSTLWFVIPSLAFFVILPVLLQRGLAFPWSFAIACVSTMGLYAATSWIVSRVG